MINGATTVTANDTTTATFSPPLIGIDRCRR